MKKLITLSLILLSTLFIYSCSTGVDKSEQEDEKIKAEKLKVVDTQHNEMLDRAYEHLNNADNLSEGEESLKSFFIEDIKASKEYSEESKKVATNYIKENFNYDKSQGLKSKRSVSEATDTLSTAVKSYLNRLKTITTTADNSKVTEKYCLS